MASDKEEGFFEALFVQLVVSLNEAAMIQLGKLANPATGQPEPELTQAEGTIDVLRMLQAKTKGNLSDAEKRLIDQTLANLEMNFLLETERSEGNDADTEETRPRPGIRPEQAN